MKRLFVEKKLGFRTEAEGVLADIRDSLHLPALAGVRVLQRYDIEGMDDAALARVRDVVFAEPPVDDVFMDELPPLPSPSRVFAVEFLPGQFDQRADSAAQCVQMLAGGERPRIASARVFVLLGELREEEVDAVKRFLINPVDSREAGLALPETLSPVVPAPEAVPVLADFNSGDPAQIRAEMGLAMSAADVAFCQDYFRSVGRAPSLTEIRVLDTYWSDHCRHTTFLTRLEKVSFDDSPQTAPLKAAWELYLATRKRLGRESRDVCLMDVATLAARALKADGLLDDLEESEEINAASIVVPVTIRRPAVGLSAAELEATMESDDSAARDAVTEEWLVMFKNETHNHPTEIEPFGGAATCLGGAIRDPLSGRSYVYQAMRVTGAGDPRTPFEQTLAGKLPQRKITRGAARGYSSYGNQIGLATGLVSEVYDEGFVAKRMEIGAVVAACPRAQVQRGTPAAGDIIVLVGGRTGRDGIGGATGSSKEHTETALQNSAEVQKGDAPTERKLQRLFRDPATARLVKRCNDFGAGGVCVAIGELAPALDIDLDAVPLKYDGLNGTELAISESQERMAVVLAPADVAAFRAAAAAENLETAIVARVTDNGLLRMTWRGQRIVELRREFIDTNGVRQTAEAHVAAPSLGARTSTLGARTSCPQPGNADFQSADPANRNTSSNVQRPASSAAYRVLSPESSPKSPSSLTSPSSPSPADACATALAANNAPATTASVPQGHHFINPRLQSGDAASPDAARIAMPSEHLPQPAAPVSAATPTTFRARWLHAISRLNTCSQRGLGERFDASIGAATVLHPFGGKNQLTPPDAMCAKLPVLDGETNACTLMAYGYDPALAHHSPGHAAIAAVVESVARIVASGGDPARIRLTFQEYFEKLGTDPHRWGKPLAALLGAFHAQMALGLPAIGGKDSMSGSFKDLDVPPTLVSFAIAPADARHIISPEFKQAGSAVWMIQVPSLPAADDADANNADANLTPDEHHLRYINQVSAQLGALKTTYTILHDLIKEGVILSARTVRQGGLAAAITEMCLGNGLGFRTTPATAPANSDPANSDPATTYFTPHCANIVVEVAEAIGDGFDRMFRIDELRENQLPASIRNLRARPTTVRLGKVTQEPIVEINPQDLRHPLANGTNNTLAQTEPQTITLPLAELRTAWESPLETTFPTHAPDAPMAAEAPTPVRADLCVRPSSLVSQASEPAASPALTSAVRTVHGASAPRAPRPAPRPRVLIPVFPGTNCEYDTARAFRQAGAIPHILVLRNQTPADVQDTLATLVAALDNAQILMLPGGFSAGDEPDGSGKFIAAVFHNPAVRDATHRLLHQRDGLALGICNGFQALIKLGLVPNGQIAPLTPASPTLYHNTLHRHISRYVHTRLAAPPSRSPWLAKMPPAAIHTLPCSHGEGRFIADPATLATLARNQQIAFQYCDPDGTPSPAIEWNPNGSTHAIEGILSPCGRVLGKMAHSERRAPHLAINIPEPAATNSTTNPHTSTKHQPLFESGVEYFG